MEVGTEVSLFQAKMFQVVKCSSKLYGFAQMGMVMEAMVVVVDGTRITQDLGIRMLVMGTVMEVVIQVVGLDPDMVEVMEEVS